MTTPYSVHMVQALACLAAHDHRQRHRLDPRRAPDLYDWSVVFAVLELPERLSGTRPPAGTGYDIDFGAPLALLLELGLATRDPAAKWSTAITAQGRALQASQAPLTNLLATCCDWLSERLPLVDPERRALYLGLAIYLLRFHALQLPVPEAFSTALATLALPFGARDLADTPHTRSVWHNLLRLHPAFWAEFGPRSATLAVASSACPL